MGLDIYSGTLTRYYTRNWKTVVEQWAEENGYAFARVTPDDDSASVEAVSPEEVQVGVADWREQILAAIAEPGQEAYAPWTEDNEKPYFTDKPDWDAYGAMLLVAACHIYGESVPAAVPKDWEFMEHPLIVRMSEDQEQFWSLFRGVTWWLPLPDHVMFQAPLPAGEQAMVGTTAGLRKELEQLNAMAWQADEETIGGWRRSEGYPVEGNVSADGLMNKAKIPAKTQYDTQSLARFAFSIFYQALQFSEENNTPVLLDY